MKKLILITILLSAMAGWGQNYNYQSYELAAYKSKADKAKKLKKNGIIFTATGTASLITGIIFTQRDPYIGVFAGGIFIIYGVIGIGIGVPFWIVGDYRSKHNRNRTYRTSLTLGTTLHGVGLVLNL